MENCGTICKLTAGVGKTAAFTAAILMFFI